MIQNRMTMVTSCQPSSSKWCCSGRHPEHPFAGGLEAGHLDDHRERDRDEQAAEDDDEQLGAGEDRQPGERATQGQRAGVAHEDLGRRGVPPQEAEAGAHAAGRDDREVERVAHLVALGARVPLAVLVELPDADEHVGGEDHDRGAGGQAVEPVGEVHAVRGARHDDVGPDDEQDDAAQGAHERQVEGGVAHERHRGRGRGAERAVGELQREDREDHRDQGLPGELLAGAQARGCAAC